MTGLYLRNELLTSQYFEENKDKINEHEVIKESKKELIEINDLRPQKLVKIALQKVKSINDYPDEIEKIDYLLDPTKTRGVIEGGFIVSRYPDKLFTGTDKLRDCIGVSFYDHNQKIVLIGHFRIKTDIASTFIEFTKIFRKKKCEALDIRLFGGITFEESNGAFDSNELLQNIMLALYRLSQSFKITIYSLDVLDRIADYRNLKEKQTETEGGDLTIGFALNTSNGKVLLQNNAYNKSHHFDVEINNCGIFSGFSKRALIYLALHSYWTNSDTLNLDYDSDDPDFDTNYIEKYQDSSQTGIVKILLSKLAQDNYCTNNDYDEVTLIDFIKKKLNHWMLKHGNAFNQKTSITIHLLHYVTYSKYSSTFSMQLQPYSEEQANNLFINWLLAKGKIQSWCLNNVRSQIIEEIKLSNQKTLDLNLMATYLEQVTSDYHLLDEWVRYKYVKDAIKHNGADPTDYQDLLLFILKNAFVINNDIQQLLTIWQKTMLYKAINKKFIENIEKIFMEKYSKYLDEAYKNNLMNFIKAWVIENDGIKLLNHLHPKSITYSKVISLNYEITELLWPRINRWCACDGFINQEIEDKLILLLANWKAEIFNDTALQGSKIIVEKDFKKVAKKEESDQKIQLEELLVNFSMR